MDRMIRYQRNDQVYKMNENDLGAHTLTVVLKEHGRDGVRTYPVRDFNLNVEAVGQCETPTATLVSPEQGDLYQ